MSPLQAAARLRRRLPVREHRIGDEDEKRSGHPVIVDGTRYKSVNQARLKLGVSVVKVYEWLDSGRARFA